MVTALRHSWKLRGSIAGHPLYGVMLSEKEFFLGGLTREWVEIAHHRTRSVWLVQRVESHDNSSTLLATLGEFDTKHEAQVWAEANVAELS